MGYHIDLSSLSIDAYKEKLKTCHLPPSRQILRQKIDERMDYFKSTGLVTVRDLLLMLKKKGNFLKISAASSMSEEYLKILLRELNSLLPKPNKLSEFPRIAPPTVSALEAAGIRNTFHLFEHIKTSDSREKLARDTGIPQSSIMELTSLTDLSRIKWVGATFARMLYDLGIDTAEKVSRADPEWLHKELNDLNRKQAFFNGTIGLNDIRILTDTASDVSFEIEY